MTNLITCWCANCGLQMELHPENNTYLPCPSCRSEEAKIMAEPDKAKNDWSQILEDNANLGPGPWTYRGVANVVAAEKPSSLPIPPPGAKVETVACAAFLLHSGLIIADKRHHNLFAQMQAAGLSKNNVREQGFMTTQGRFVDREVAKVLQETAGIPSASRDGYRGRELYSEDLY